MCKTGNVGLNVILRRVHVTIVAIGGNKSSECVFVSLFIEYAKFMRRTLLSSVAYTDVPYFSTLSHKRHHFVGKKRNVFEDKCVF
jgi:hypothetical protein